jgi:hypothetical protein
LDLKLGKKEYNPGFGLTQVSQATKEAMDSGASKRNRNWLWKGTMQHQQGKISYNRTRKHASPNPEDPTHPICMRCIRL